MAYSTDKSTAIHANGHTMGYCASVVDMNDCYAFSSNISSCIYVDVHSVYSSETEAVNLDSSTGISRVSKALINVFEEVQHVLGNKVILRL